MYPYDKQRSIYRGRNAPVREGVIQDPTGTWVPAERNAEATRVSTARAAAAATALAATNAKIAAIRGDGSKTAQQKLYALRQLTASGHSDEEFTVLRAAQETG